MPSCQSHPEPDVHAARREPLRLTVGAGDARPQGRCLVVAVAQSRAHALTEALNSLAPGTPEGWWSAACFRGDYRDGARWLSSEAVGIDPDYYGAPAWDDDRGRWRETRAPLPAATLEKFRQGLADGSLPGSLAHDTPGGLRVVFVLDKATSDPQALHAAAVGSSALVQAWLKAQGLGTRQENGVASHGLKIDTAASTDRVRFWYAPRARAKGVQRNATVEVVRDRTFTLGELAQHAKAAGSPSKPARTSRGGARPATLTDFDAAVAAFNSANPADWPASGGDCPACGHKDCFGQLDDNPTRWVCFSSNHALDAGGCGVAGAGCWHGDALDLAAHAARVSRAEVLRREGHLPAGKDTRADTTGGAPGAEQRGAGGSVSSVGSVGREATPWPPLLPFGLETAPEPFPVDALPLPMAIWVRAEAQMLQCPEDLPALLCRGVGSVAVAKKRIVRVHAKWLEPLNQFLVAGLLSGESKSPAFDDATLPLRSWEREALRRLGPIYERAQREQAARRARIRHLEQKASRLQGGPDRDELTKEIDDVTDAMARAPRVRLPRLSCEDITPEKLADEIARHGGRMGLLSDEAGPFEMMAGRYSDSPRLEVYLKGYSGSRLLVDRKGLPGVPVPSLKIEHPTLTMVLTVQPSVIEGLAAKKEMRTRGMLARFSYSLPASRVGRRAPQTPCVTAAVAEEYQALISRLLDLQAPEDEEGEYQPPEIGLSQQASEQLFALKAALEPRLGPGRDLAPMQDWVNKHFGRVLRTAGLLHLAGAAPERLRDLTVVSGDEMERAIAIGAYDLAHARRAFASMAEPEDMADARAILAWINRRGGSEFKERDAHRALEHRFPRVEGLRRGLVVLEERSYVRVRQEERERSGRGGRPGSPMYEVHPDLAQGGLRPTEPTEPTEPASPESAERAASRDEGGAR